MKALYGRPREMAFKKFVQESEYEQHLEAIQMNQEEFEALIGELQQTYTERLDSVYWVRERLNAHSRRLAEPLRLAGVVSANEVHPVYLCRYLSEHSDFYSNFKISVLGTEVRVLAWPLQAWPPQSETSLA